MSKIYCRCYCELSYPKFPERMNDSKGLLNHNDYTAEEAPLVEREKSWTKTDKILLVFGAMMYFGDGVETYLPGSLMQKNSSAPSYKFFCRWNNR